MAKHSIMQPMLYDCPGTLVFGRQRCRQNWWCHPQRQLTMRWLPLMLLSTCLGFIALH